MVEAAVPSRHLDAVEELQTPKIDKGTGNAWQRIFIMIIIHQKNGHCLWGEPPSKQFAFLRKGNQKPKNIDQFITMRLLIIKLS